MSLIEDIKQEEGFVGYQYLDSLNKKTIGYGTLLPLSKKEAELLLNSRLNNFISNVKSSLYDLDIKDEAWEILYHMSYQLGIGGLLQFKNMIKALREQDYEEASREMRNSLWHKQTPNRANRLADKMAKIVEA